MAYQDFELTILSPRLKAVAQHWMQCKGSRLMPSWSAIDPTAIHEHLSIVFSYVYDATADEFFGRLAGNTIASISGNDFKGVGMKHLRPLDRFLRAFERAKRVLNECALYRGEGTIYVANDQRYVGERIVLPLSSDAINADGIVGAADTHAVPSYYPLSEKDGKRTIGIRSDEAEWLSATWFLFHRIRNARLKNWQRGMLIVVRKLLSSLVSAVL